MFKKMLALLIAVVLAFSAMSLTASAAETVTVTVITYEPMSPMYTVQAPYGEPYTAPEPVLSETESGVFAGWYTDAEYKYRFEDGTRLYANLMLFPRYVPESEFVIVSYYLDADSEYPVGGTTYVRGDIPSLPENPDREDEGLWFMGWFSDPDFHTEFDFSKPLTESVDLYARFVPEDDIVYLDIYLDPDSEYPVVSGTYVKGDCPAQPEDPGSDGVTFMGWYADKALTTPFDFDEPLCENSAIYARFVPNEDVVGVCFFMGPDEDYPYADCMVVKGEAVAEPDEPYIDDMVFAGWYSDRALKNRYDFSQPVNQYLNLFARFVTDDDCYSVWIYLDADAEEPTVGFDVPNGNPIPAREDPGREGFTFGGWYTDRALTVPADFSYAYDEEVCLYAKWIPKAHHHECILVAEVPATATQDGVKDHLYCAGCGKIFYAGKPTLVEVENYADLIIPATGSYQVGDVDGSGEVINRDAVILDRYIAGWIGYEQQIKNRDAADLNRDSKITNRDAVILDRYIAGWSGYEAYIIMVNG